MTFGTIAVCYLAILESKIKSCSEICQQASNSFDMKAKALGPSNSNGLGRFKGMCLTAWRHARIKQREREGRVRG